MKITAYRVSNGVWLCAKCRPAYVREFVASFPRAPYPGIDSAYFEVEGGNPEIPENTRCQQCDELLRNTRGP